MVVTVKLHTILGRQTPGGTQRNLDVELPLGSTMEDLLDYLEIELSEDALLLMVNGRLVEIHTVLQPDDRINLMPAISGGT